MLNRHYDATRFNEIVNHPKILPWVSADGKELDLSEAINNHPDNVCLVDDLGAILFFKLQNGLYEAHTQILPEGRGRWARNFAEECLQYLFCNTDALEVMTKVPENNKGALGLARLLRFDFDFTNPQGWRNIDGIISTDIYSLNIQKWMRFASNIEKSGKWFHESLESQYKELGKLEPLHEENDTHDKYVGICVEMIKGGQIFKAINFYNRWAIMASYVPMKLISVNPIIIDMGESVLQIENEPFEFKVIYLR